MNTDYNEKRIVECVDRILRFRNIEKLTKETYHFITLYCGSIAHYDIHGWESEYRDLRDFINFFLVRNEYGDCLSELGWRRDLDEEQKRVIAAIIQVCRKYRDEVFLEANARERKLSLFVGEALVAGKLTIKDVAKALNGELEPPPVKKPEPIRQQTFEQALA